MTHPRDPLLIRESKVEHRGITVSAGVQGDILSMPGPGNTEDAHIMREAVDEVSRAILAQMFTTECLEEMYTEMKRGAEIEGIVNGPAT